MTDTASSAPPAMSFLGAPWAASGLSRFWAKPTSPMTTMQAPTQNAMARTAVIMISARLDANDPTSLLPMPIAQCLVGGKAGVQGRRAAAWWRRWASMKLAMK